MAGITLDQAQTQLDAWLAANVRVASNQSYSIGGRTLTRANAKEIRDQVDFWDRQVKRLSLVQTGRSRVRYVEGL